ncbi:MAG: transcriptional regulator with GAF, ATPase, and Fis domain [Myxococcota bacterium]|jgi:transcriptional regulator with GAF, ATPase, and Fis domain
MAPHLTGFPMAYLQCEHTLTSDTSAYLLKKAITTVGRSSGNDVVLKDPMVESSHVSLMRKGGGHAVSLTGKGELYVNGRLTRSAQLSHGDALLIGGWQVTYQAGEPKPIESETIGDGVGLDILEDLVSLSSELMRDTAPEKLYEALLSALVRLTRAEKGFLIIFKDDKHHLAASHNVDDRRLDLGGVSDSIVRQVIESREPVIVSDALRDSRFASAQSVVDLRLSSVMCVPLIYRNDLLGVIYLGNDSVTDLFTERDLALLRVYASQAALVTHTALLLNQLKLDNQSLRTRLTQSAQGGIIGNSAGMKSIFKVLRKVSPTDLSVLVLGETGTGKELVARESHRLSARKDGPFIAINCGAIPENLLESELFGHKKGSFTGAVNDKIGKVEAASGGTLFLDEIGEMPMNLQVKLLRVLQERVIERVGEIEPRPIEIRVISATNQNLKELIRSGQFREDLLYRLNEITLELPALRERGDDIVMLAQFFLNKYREQYGGRARGFTNQAMASLKQHYWPGNVRELESRVKKALIMGDRPMLNPDDMGLEVTEQRDIDNLADATEAFKLDYIRQALDLNHWNKAQTARQLGVDARTIFRYVEKLGEA